MDNALSPYLWRVTFLKKQRTVGKHLQESRAKEFFSRL